MSKRKQTQNKVIKYAIHQGKLIPRNEVLRKRLSVADFAVKEADKRQTKPVTKETKTQDNQSSEQNVGYTEMTVKVLKALLDERDVPYDSNTKKDDLVELAIDSDEDNQSSEQNVDDFVVR